jgi:hypothetical protein
MTERILITRLVRHGDRADLFGRGHQWKDLTLFDLSDLVDVGIDYRVLPESEDTPCRFWAHYSLSEKLNKAGNPYKDVVALEPIDKPATATSTDTTALLQELREIRHLLEGVAQVLGAQGGLPLAGTSPNWVATLRYADGQSVGDNEAEIDAFNAYLAAEGTVAGSVDALRQWVLDAPQ